MAWGYSGNVFKEVTAFQEQTQESESFGFEYQRIGKLARYQGRADHTKYRIGLCGAKCRTNTQGDVATAELEYIRLASISINMIPAAVRVFTSWQTGLTVDNRYFVGLAYPATEDEEANDTGRVVGHTLDDVFRLYRAYFGRIHADGSAATDTLNTKKNKDEERMLTTWPNIITSKEYDDWTLNRFNKSIKEVWKRAQTLDGMNEAASLPPYLDIILNNVNAAPAWTDNDFMQFNCTFVDGG